MKTFPKVDSYWPFMTMLFWQVHRFTPLTPGPIFHKRSRLQRVLQAPKNARKHAALFRAKGVLFVASWATAARLAWLVVTL